MHRHGAHLERPCLRRPGGGRHPGGHQRGLPDPRLRRARLLLPPGPARLARPRPDRPRRLDVGASPGPCWSSSASRCLPATSPAPSASGPGVASGTRPRSCPRIGPAALYGLLFTIVLLFALQGDTITNQPLDVARIALPLLAYFVLMWGGSMVLTRALGFDYQRATAVSFTAAGNNFELAIAVAIGVFGVASGQALAGVVGPLIEVPVLVGLVYVSLWARRFFPDRTTVTSHSTTSQTAAPTDSTDSTPAGRLRLRPQRRALGHQPGPHRALRRRPRPRAVRRHPARRAHPPRGRRGAGEARAWTPPGAAQAADPRHHRRQHHGHHPRLRRGVPLRSRV